MRPLVFFLTVLGALVVPTALLGGTTDATRSTDGAVVASVHDGDTLTLQNGRRVRLLQIDTPELGSGECYSRAARTALLRLAPVGARIVLEVDGGLDRVDRYGRLASVRPPLGHERQSRACSRGRAAPYFYRGERGRYAAKLLAAAKQAKAAKRGLWKACTSTVLDPTNAVTTGRSGPAVVPKAAGKCDSNYTGGCVPPYPPDLDCADIRALGIAPVRVVGSDPHGLDGDGDGWGCE